MTPLQRYQRDIDEGRLRPDPAQARGIREVQALYEQLQRRRKTLFPWVSWWRRLRGRVETPRGLYFHGGVGRGKTYVMDTFHESLPDRKKLRTHFHRFMQRVHRELAGLRRHPDPLETVAGRLARQARVICFDEFFVSDIGDAMILGTLLEHLFREGVVLVATSNIHPDQLYANGLQRERFLPAIELLHAHTRIVELDGGVDHRLRSLRQARMYHAPLDDQAEAALLESFQSLVPGHARPEENVDLEVLGRTFRARRVAEDVVWFDFAELCGGPRSANDYIELAREFHAVVLSGVPRMGESGDDAMRRFVSLVDELYDRHVKLIISAEAPMRELYRGSELAVVFERTTSRLLEMQSEEYLAREHRP